MKNIYASRFHHSSRRYLTYKIFHMFIVINITYLPSEFCFLRILHRAIDAIIPPAAILVAKYDVVVEGGIALSRERYQ